MFEMGAPRPRYGIVGLIQGKINEKKLIRTYNEAYSQIIKLWSLLPESAKSNLTPENEEQKEMEVDASPLQSNKSDLEDRLNSIKGKNVSYKDRMVKKKLKNQLKKMKKNYEKQTSKEENRKRRKEIQEKIKAEKLKNGKISESPLEKSVCEVIKGIGDLSTCNGKKPMKLFNSITSVAEDKDEEMFKNEAKKQNKGSKIEDFIVTGIEEEETSGLSKKKLKLLKKKELKAEKRKERKKLIKIKQTEEAKMKLETEVKEEVPTVSQLKSDKDGEIMFNKIDFAKKEKKKFKKERQKTEKDPAKALTKIEELNKKINDLRVSGQEEKAEAIQSKETWKNAILKADGVKVKDDVKLLKKTIRRKEKKKSKSKEEWQQRIGVKEKKMADAQKKRKENILKKKKEKKQKKIKKSIKKGRVVI